MNPLYEQSDLEGKTAIVTGAASGIGREASLVFGRERVKVVVSDVDMEGGEETVRMIKSNGGEATFIRANVADPEDVQSLVEKTIETYGELHFACNNAGVGGESQTTADYPLDAWKRVIAINLNGVFYCMKYQIPAMLKAGRGVIVNMASILGQVGFPSAPAYVTAKHGVIGLTKNAALEYAQQNLRVLAVCPAFIKTPMVEDGLPPEALAQITQMHPIGRLGMPNEVAELVVWLCTNHASFMTGEAILVDGGYVAQ